MKSRETRIAIALTAGLLVLPTSASAWVAVRIAPRVLGVAAVGVAAGAVAGAAVANTAAYAYQPPPTVVVAPPATTTAPTTTAAPSTTVGTVVTTLPSGCQQSGERYQCGSVWYQPYFGANGVYYKIVNP